MAAFLASQRGAAFPYAEVGATRGEQPPAGCTVHRNRLRLGAGGAAFERAVAALFQWRMLAHGWAFVAPTATSSGGTRRRSTRWTAGHGFLVARSATWSFDEP